MTNALNDGLNKPDQLADSAVVTTEIGSGAVLYSPLFAKLQEVFFKSEPYTATKRKQIETQMQIVITLGFFLIVYGLIISLF